MASKGFTVLGFPCNQFGAQEPGDAEEIANFCKLTYDVSFPMMGKIDVNGDNAAPIYRHLKDEAPGLLGIASRSSGTSPNSWSTARARWSSAIRRRPSPRISRRTSRRSFSPVCVSPVVEGMFPLLRQGVPMATTGPVGERERIAEMDILRGVALLGVLLMNFVAFAGPGWMATETQLKALPSAEIDWWTFEAIRLFVGDKANTTFATLFGLGFYIQMTRGEGRPGFEARYRRRLLWLLIFGWLNAIFLWVWDILNLYALAGFFLLMTRRWSTRGLVIFGTLAALYSDHLQDWLIKTLAIPLPDRDYLYADAAILQRQDVAVHGSYWQNVESMWTITWVEWLAGGLMVAWVIYALGRFALGAAIGRSGVLSDVDRHLPLFRRIAATAIPLGLVLGLLIRLIMRDYLQLPGGADGWKEFAGILRSPAALILAAGYCSGIIVALRSPWGRRLFTPFGAVGRMALTNYLAQGFIYAFILFGVGPGLGLAGKIGSFAVVLICLAFFAAQMVVSHLWLARYRFGPMEWIWRTLTYGERPQMRRAQPIPATA